MMLDDEFIREWCIKNQKNFVKVIVVELVDFFIYLYEECNCKLDIKIGNM